MTTELAITETDRTRKAGSQTAPQWRDLPIHLLIIEREEFIVFLDEVDDVDWKTSDAYDNSHGDTWKECGSVLNRVSFLHAIPITHLASAQRLGFRRMLGEAVARALEDNMEAAEHMLGKAEEFITSRNHEHARYWYPSAATLTAGLVLFGTFLLWIGRFHIVPLLSQGLFDTLVAFGVGAIGALLSTFGRVAKLPLDPSAGRRLHYFEGASHIFLGAVGGGIVWLASASGVVAPQILSATHGRMLWLLLCVLGGASERLVPTLVDRFEIAVARQSAANSAPGTSARRKSSR